MIKPRIEETRDGIQEVDMVHAYDEMQRCFKNKGWIETDGILKSGITKGNVLEVGPGPGYLGLEWLNRTNNTKLTGLDISKEKC